MALVMKGTQHSVSIQTPSLFHILLRNSLILKLIELNVFLINLHTIHHNDKAKAQALPVCIDHP
jgi:hypothetical protein